MGRCAGTMAVLVPGSHGRMILQQSSISMDLANLDCIICTAYSESVELFILLLTALLELVRAMQKFGMVQSIVEEMSSSVIHRC